MKIKTLEELIEILNDDPKTAHEQEPWHLLDQAKDVIDAANAVLRYDRGDGGSRLILESDLQRLQVALDVVNKNNPGALETE